MTRISFDDMRRLLAMAAEVWPRKTTDRLAEAYQGALEGWTGEEVEGALKELMKEETRFPTPYVWIERMKMQRGDRPGGYTAATEEIEHEWTCPRCHAASWQSPQYDLTGPCEKDGCDGRMLRGRTRPAQYVSAARFREAMDPIAGTAVERTMVLDMERRIEEHPDSEWSDAEHIARVDGGQP